MNDYNLSITNKLTSEMLNRMLGMNSLVSSLNNMNVETGNYPPHNVVKVEGEDYILELAVAGWDEKDLTISVEDSKLTVIGTSKDNEKNRQISYKGISSKSFTKSFLLSPYHEVDNATLKNGLLSISVKYILPEELKPKQIPILSD